MPVSLTSKTKTTLLLNADSSVDTSIEMLPLSVKIPGKLLIAEPQDGYTQVEFTDLALTPYVMNNQINFTATAKNVTVKKEG